MFKFSQTLANTKRVTQIVTILSKNGFENIVKKINFEGNFKLPLFQKIQHDHLNQTQRIKKTVEELGPTFIKLAQMLSTRPDLISLALMHEFEKLQDKVTPVEIEEITPIFKEAFDKEVHELFAKPLTLLATASIGQVYRTQLLTGEEVVVKVLKPHISTIIYNDLEILKQIASLFDGAFKEYGIYSLLEIVKEFEHSIKHELDFKLEAMNLNHFEMMFQEDKRIKVPKLYKAYSNHKIITMEFIEGIKISDRQTLQQYHIDSDRLVELGFELLCEQIFRYRFFHADPHPGNIFVTYDGKISFIDFGIMGSLGQDEHKKMMDLVYHLSKKEPEKAALDILNMTNFPTTIDKNSFVKEMSSLITLYLYQELKEIRIKELFTDMTTLVSKHAIAFQSSYYLLFKALVTIEGVGSNLNPNFNAMKHLTPIIEKLYQEELSLFNILKKLSDLPINVRDFFDYTPSALKELLEQMKRGHFRVEFEHKGLEPMEETIEKSFNRLTVSIVIASTLIGSSLVLLAKTPPLIYEIPLLGIIGFGVACGMGIVLAYSIYKLGRL